jgi:hypothetical protein
MLRSSFLTDLLVPSMVKSLSVKNGLGEPATYSSLIDGHRDMEFKSDSSVSLLSRLKFRYTPKAMSSLNLKDEP